MNKFAKIHVAASLMYKPDPMSHACYKFSHFKIIQADKQN